METPKSPSKPAKVPGASPPKPENGDKRFSRFFIHWRSKKLMDAWEYGYKAWPIGGKA